MARLWTTGFELQSNTAGVEFTANGIGSGGISTTTFRSPGAASMQLNPTAAFSWAGQRFATALTTGTVYARAYINISAIPTVGRAQILVFYDAAGVSAQGSVELDATGALQMWNAGSVATVSTASSILSTGTWYCVEVSYNGSTGAMTARLDGTQFATGTGSTGTGCNAVYFGSPSAAATFNVFWDDMAINDTTGAGQTSWPGTATRLEYLRPAGAGSVNTFATQTGGTAGSANNYTRVNETTPNDATSYNGSSTLNQEDMFTVGASAMGASDTVAVVQVGFRYANSTADTTAAITAQIKKSSAGTVASSAAIAPNSVTWKTNNATTAQSYPLTLYNDPDGTAWTSTTIGTTQIGYKLTTGPGTAGRQVRVTAVWVIVESNAPTGSVITKTQPATARIAKNLTATQSATARIQRVVTKTQPVTGRIANNRTITQPAVARIAIKPTRTQVATARVAKTVTKTQTATAHITSFKKVVHIGSQSLDVHTNTQTEINNIVSALVTAIPNLTHIAISTYMDYAATGVDNQLGKWATAIHTAGKKMWYRSAGFNWWQGTNGVAQYTGSDFVAKARADMYFWLFDNYSVFQNGDVFSPIPDEPENNSMWNTTYGTIASGTGLTAFNSLITGAIDDAEGQFSSLGVKGVEVRSVFTNASASRDVLNSPTEAYLLAMGTDNYPEPGLTTPEAMAAAMTSELTTYVAGYHTSRRKHITFGPSVYTQLSQGDQAGAVIREYDAIQTTLTKPNMDGVTLWQFGAVDNAPKSRLFDWNGTIWVARQAAASVNDAFGFYKIQAATARISQTTTATQLATARIQRVVTKTQTATARISQSLTRTQPATARIAQTFTKTQPAVARVARNLTKTQPATARIQKVVTKTQLAVARVAQSFTKIQPTVARISNSRTLAQPAISRIAVVLTKTQPITARVATNLIKTQPANANITNSRIKTLTAIARIAVRLTKTQPATARIVQTRTRTQPAIARIQYRITKTQTVTASVAQTFTKTQTARASIVLSATAGNANITISLSSPVVTVVLNNTINVDLLSAPTATVTLSNPTLTVGLNNNIMNVGLNANSVNVNIQ